MVRSTKVSESPGFALSLYSCCFDLGCVLELLILEEFCCYFGKEVLKILLVGYRF